MADLRYTSDLINDVLFRCGEPTDGLSEYQAVALTYLNRAYWMIASGGGELIPDLDEEWLWLRNSSPGTIGVIPAIAPGVGNNPGSVDATFGSTTITFAGAIGENLVSLQGWEIKIGDNPDIYRIATHTINTATATMDMAWGGPTGTYLYLTGKLEYSLGATVLRVLSPLRCFQGNANQNVYTIHEVDRERLYGSYPLVGADGGMPNVFSRVTEQLIRFDTYASPPTVGGWAAQYRVEYDYLRIPTMLTSPGISEEPLVPWPWRRVLSDYATFWLLIDKNDDRAEGIGASAKGGLQAMAHENQRMRKSYDRTPVYGALMQTSNNRLRGLR